MFYLNTFRFTINNRLSIGIFDEMLLQMKNIFILLFFFNVCLLNAQSDRWQQSIKYKIDIDFEVSNHTFVGQQEITYFNNSPDSLHQLFFHLYLNAFQPGSDMDIRSLTIKDPDRRVGERINQLNPDEIGYQNIEYLAINGIETDFHIEGTVMEIHLNNPLLPNSENTINIKFKGQVPIQVRRNGRNSREGIAYSMAQWYPKLAEYDYLGWHANPYIGREFYGIWGDFDVTITIDKNYVLGGTGYLQNPNEIGHGYENNPGNVNIDNEKIKWHFVAPNVHDFVWSADPDYRHIKYLREDGMEMHFLFEPGERTTENWEKLPNVMDQVFEYINKRFGQYAYKQYSFLQGGDGGMEYPMATLITGQRSFSSLVGVAVHELMHSWYQMMLGSNESLYPWMDEGFTSYASNEVMNYLKKQNLIPGDPSLFPQSSSYNSYINFSKSGYEEPLITHADHFSTNAAYGVGSYSKGAVFMHQLEYIIGKNIHEKALLDYFNTWKFKHPNANDLIRIMEKNSMMELDWYKEYFVHSTHSIDYGIEKVSQSIDSNQTEIILSRIGNMPMPIDLFVTLKDGTIAVYNIPLGIMRGEKQNEWDDLNYEILSDWHWVAPNYEMILPFNLDEIQKIEIDPSMRLADTERANNIFENL